MMYFYAVYFTFCVLGYKSCVEDRYRYDAYWTPTQAERMISYEGEHPNWKNVSGDLVLTYAYGECYKGRVEGTDDINMEIYTHWGGDCPSCVCWNN